VVAEAALRAGLDAMAEKKAARFPRAVRLLRHADFQRVYKQGRRHFSATMTVFYLARPEAAGRVAGASERADVCSELPARTPALLGLRVGFTVGRVLGGAVDRNRMKRRLREAVRLTLPEQALAVDVVINPKKTLLDAEFTDVVREVERAFAVIEQKLASAKGSKGSVTQTMQTQTGAPAPHESGLRKS